MEVIGIGIDLVEISRLRRAMERHEGFVPRVFSPREISYCEDCAAPARRYAACFAAKEAAAKALGTGVRGFSWRELELLREEGGKPVLLLSGRAKRKADEMGVAEMLVSVSHSGDLAVAVVQALGR